MKLRFGEKIYTPDIRMLYDMKEVIFDERWFKNADNVPLYYMYRDLALTEDDRRVIIENDLRYDVTVIPPGTLGREYLKTAGHYHPKKNDLSYAEIYEVLAGRAHYLLQRGPEKIMDVILVEAEKGDKVIIPPNYGHITINPFEEEIKMANWVSRRFSSIYEPIRKMRGGTYYETSDGLIRNKNYKSVPRVRRTKAREYPELGIFKGEGMYDLIRSPEKLRFLNYPEDYKWFWSRIFDL